MNKQTASNLSAAFGIQHYRLMQQHGQWLYIWATPYSPLDYAKECYIVDGYYLASHSTYVQTAQMIRWLQQQSTPCQTYNGQLKSAAIHTGLGQQMRNGLVAVHGTTYVVLSAISSPAFSPMQPTCNSQHAPACNNCSLCINSCPTDALTDGWHMQRCIRYIQEKGKEMQKHQDSDRLLGCDICQRVCKHNQHATPAVPPTFMAEFFAKSQLRTNLQDDQKLRQLGQLIGSNYARRNKLQSLLQRMQPQQE